MSEVKVKITQEESTLIESMFFKYNAEKDLFGTLIQNGVPTSNAALQEMKSGMEQMFRDLEREKESVATKYLPNDRSMAQANYSFNFITQEIVYS